MNPLIDIDAEVCQDASRALELEWLLTNGLGGYAASTIIGCNIRRYHGLLNIALTPPTNRRLMLVKYDEKLLVDGNEYSLSSNLTTVDAEAEGQRFMSNFRLDPFPIFTFAAGDCEIEKRLFMVQKKNTVVVRYRIISGSGDIKLVVTPYVTFRDIHTVNPTSHSLDSSMEEYPGVLHFRATADAPRLVFYHNAESIGKPKYSWARFYYPAEEGLGFEHVDFILKMCEFIFTLSKEHSASITATSEEETLPPAIYLEREEIRRHQSFAKRAIEIHPLKQEDKNLLMLLKASDSFIVKRGDGVSIIAGYPWFTDSGRASMVSLPGLLLATGRYEEARSLLISFLRYYKDGLIPNIFPDGEEEPLYNTIDASLWFIHAVYEYYLATRDLDTICNPLMEVVRDIIQNYVKGTRFGICQDSDGLLSGGEKGWQITWMDAKVNGRVITPRIGKNVEINALWYHALRIAAYLSDLLGDETGFTAYEIHAEKVRQSFEKKFWFEDGEYLYDTLGETGHDASIRPNQIFAISLPNPILTGEKATAVLETVRRFLLTPYGLRSLAPGHPDYKKCYRGNSLNHDIAYHQGTVWAWLIGPYIDALLNVKGSSRDVAQEGLLALQPLLSHLEDACVGSISEIFDAEPPHAPRGCLAQAWSVAELLRVYVRLLRMVHAESE